MKQNFLLFVALLGSGCVMAEPRMKVTFHITDAETKDVLTNAQVMVYNNGWETKKVDMGGFCTFEGRGLSMGWKGHSKLDGYYNDSSGVTFTKWNRVLNRREPWDPTIEVKMRPIKNPVSMVQKRVESLKIPAWDEQLGFDLEKADWTAPYGKGIQADFFVNMSRRFEHSSDYDAVATITFPNEGDGIQLYTMLEEFQTSSYKFPYEAPVDGYKNTYVFERHATLRETKCTFNPEKDMYIFRARTKKDKDGNIVSANYGRMGRIEIGWGEVFDTSYWFNPVPNERSLEYSGKNLLKK